MILSVKKLIKIICLVKRDFFKKLTKINFQNKIFSFVSKMLFDINHTMWVNIESNFSYFLGAFKMASILRFWLG